MDSKGHRTKTARMLLALAGRWAHHSFNIFIAGVAILIMTAPNAYAYIDPGHGALVWQALLAGFFGAIFYMRRIVRSIRTLISARESRTERGK